jgi:hypothetical protein
MARRSVRVDVGQQLPGQTRYGDACAPKRHPQAQLCSGLVVHQLDDGLASAGRACLIAEDEGLERSDGVNLIRPEPDKLPLVE